MLDYRDPMWATFDIQPILIPLVTVGNKYPNGNKPPVEPPADRFRDALAFVLKQEGGWADNPADPGGATMKGITFTTFRNWRQAHGQPIPSKQDLRNISDAEVEQIYREWYWLASGADNLPWPLALAHFDLAVNGGTGRAKQALEEAGYDFLRLLAWRLDWYTRIPGWDTFGAGWTRRVAAVLREGAA